MRLKKYISGSSIMESVIAIAIIAFCMTIGLIVFVRITEQKPASASFSVATQLKQELASYCLQKVDKPIYSIENFTQSEPYKKQQIEVAAQGDSLVFTLLTFNNLQP